MNSLENPQPSSPKPSTDPTMFPSSNPYDINYVPPEISNPDNDSPTRTSTTQVSLIQNTAIYTTSAQMEKKHQEFRRNAHAPVDPELTLKIQEQLNREALLAEQAQNRFKDSQEEVVAEESVEVLVDEEVAEVQGTQEVLANLLQDLMKNNDQGALMTMLQDTMMNSMQALQGMDENQQQQLLETIEQLQGYDSSQLFNMVLGSQPNEDTRSNGYSNSQQGFGSSNQYRKGSYSNGYQGKSQRFPLREKENQNNSNRYNEVTSQEVADAIERAQINGISLLNELSTKIKKKIHFNMREIPMGKQRIFECTCVFQKQKIGQQTENSKHSAKSSAAKEAVQTLVEGLDQLSNFDRSSFISVVERMSGRTLGRSYGQQTKFFNNKSFKPQGSMIFGSRAMSFNDKNDEYSKSLAETVIIGTYSDQNDTASNPSGPGSGKSSKDKQRALLEAMKKTNSQENNIKRNFFDTCLEDDFFDDLRNDQEFSKDHIHRAHAEFNTYLTGHIQGQHQNPNILQKFKEAFNVIAEYTLKAIKHSKPDDLAEGETHITEYVDDFKLVPTGAFALDCMRSDEMVLDALFIFNQLKEVSNLEFLELYQHAIEAALPQEEDEDANGLNFKFKIDTKVQGDCLEIEGYMKSQKFKIRIYLSNLTTANNQALKPVYNEKYDYALMHIRRVVACFEGMENKFKEFRKFMTLIRMWRSVNNLEFLRPEVLDIVLLHEFLNNPHINFANGIVECMMVLTSEEILKRVLGTYDNFYVEYYSQLLDEQKSTLSSACRKTLNCVFERTFNEEKLF